MNKTLFIIRGLPGSGKSTLAHKISPIVWEADQFFMIDGNYCFLADFLKSAHTWCQNQVLRSMQDNHPVIAVSNTFTQRWEMQPYLDMAVEHGYSVFVIVCQNNFGNIHGVPEESLERMRSRWEN